MKKCVYCGCFNQDTCAMCADCGHLLTDAEIIDKIEYDYMINKVSRYSDPFSFKPRHQIAFYASLILIIANIVSIFISLIHPEMAFISLIFSIVCVIITRFSKTLWNIKKFFLGFSVSGGIEPSDWWFISREITIFGLLIVSILTFLYGLLT
ncbi:MAG: hypothetical protein ACYCWE_06810 [Eubacteriales bacterium]